MPGCLICSLIAKQRPKAGIPSTSSSTPFSPMRRILPLCVAAEEIYTHTRTIVKRRRANYNWEAGAVDISMLCVDVCMTCSTYAVGVSWCHVRPSHYEAIVALLQLHSHIVLPPHITNINIINIINKRLTPTRINHNNNNNNNNNNSYD